ncbi:unnamed protein product [Nesidiocoris tenuis]|uniref:IMS import disulfide relay-system CHCH-CHCH-like Cx9C domain-containing protein n=1 Tax=Nesidiocoris tenuis TaxID=355587 RepID=A0A6H5GAM4_9HEMI|nr:unnamed protein product [Nesidiocoris tenuis]
MEAVKKARARMRTFPAILNDCRLEGRIYAKCVTKFDDVRKDNCLNEFNEFMKCVHTSSKNRKVKF